MYSLTITKCKWPNYIKLTRQTKAFHWVKPVYFLECQHKSMSVKHFREAFIIGRKSEGTFMPALRARAASWKDVCLSQLFSLWQRLARRGQRATNLCALGPSPFSDLLGFELQGWHYAEHRPSWPTKCTHKRDTLSQLCCRRDMKKEINGKMGNKATSKTTFTDYT